MSFLLSVFVLEKESLFQDLTRQTYTEYKEKGRPLPLYYICLLNPCWKVESAEWMRKWSLGTTGHQKLRPNICLAWFSHGLCYCPYWGVFHNPVENKNRFGAVWLQCTPSTAMVWAWLKRVSFNRTDFWELHLYIWKSISGGIIQALFFMGDSCWKQAGPGRDSVLLAYKTTFLSTQDGWQIR